MYRSDIINALIKHYNYTSYLEIGLNTGWNYKFIECEDKESCDPYIDNVFDGGIAGELPEEIQEILTYRMTSDDMFKMVDKKWDIIFIDGYHEQMQVGRDIINALKHLNPGGHIIVHDCLPESEECQIMPRQQEQWNGDVWKAIPKLNKYGIKYNVIDTDFGCAIIPYVEFSESLPEITETSIYTYDFFERYKKELMHVISVEEFKEKYLS